MPSDWTYEPTPDLDKTVVERLQNFPREPDMIVYALRSFAALGLRAWLRLYHRFSIIGADNFPQDKSFILIANHASHLDALSLISAMPLRKLHRVFPAAAADYFFTSVPRTAFAAIIVNALPFSRKIHGAQSLDVCKHLLANPGNILVIFPEGTRSKSGELGTFKPGIARLAAGNDIPVIPCYLAGAHEAWGKGMRFPRPRRLRLLVGTPRHFADLEQNKTAYTKICEQLREDVLALKAQLEPHP